MFTFSRTTFSICLSALILWLVASNCNKAPYQPSPSRQPASTSTGKRYLALGDSYTIGQGVSEPDRFPHLTVGALRSGGLSIEDPVYIARTGWTTANLQNAINSQNGLGSFDAVSLLIGVNDQYQGVDTAVYRLRFSQLLQKAVELAGGRKARVFVLSIPDYSATPFVDPSQKERVRTEIDWFNAINKEVTAQSGIAYLNITPLTRQAASDETLLAPDRLHYSRKAHQQWADLLAPLMKAVL